jgi:aspartate/methionine/tyrosine aminotransferase
MKMITSAKRIEQVEEYYFSRKLQEVRNLEAAGKKVINLGIGSPDLPPSETVVSALTSTASAATSHGYQNYKGIPELRRGVADFYKRIYKVALDPEKEILPLMGSKEGIMHISMAFVNEGDEVLIPDPGYPTYASASRLAGAQVRTYSLKEEDWSVDVEALAKTDLSNVKVMWVNYPHMPTGKRASVEEFEKLVELARENEFLLVNDNPYSLILNDNPLSILSVEGAKVGIELTEQVAQHGGLACGLGRRADIIHRSGVESEEQHGFGDVPGHPASCR